MRKTFTVVLAASLALGAFMAPMADAKKKKKKKAVVRTATSVYDSPAIGHPDAAVGCSGSTGCATFATGATERFASFKATDASGLPVYIMGGQDLTGDGLADTSFSFCGQTDAPVAIEPGYEINLFISAAPGGATSGSPCAGVGTSGSVEGKFSSKTFKV